MGVALWPRTPRGLGDTDEGLLRLLRTGLGYVVSRASHIPRRDAEPEIHRVDPESGSTALLTLRLV
jgi:hypothetical protein